MDGVTEGIPATSRDGDCRMEVIPAVRDGTFRVYLHIGIVAKSGQLFAFMMLVT